MRTTLSTIALWTMSTLASFSYADEGMWLFNSLPEEHLRATYGFEPSEAWTEHVMLSSVRFNSGGSASFVSPNGLVITNHHVASDTLHKLSTAEHNYHEDGFLAGTHAEEIPAPDLELNQLVSIEDVTERVNGAVSDTNDPEAAFKARRAVMAEIEKESLDATGLRSDVVTLYGGAQYHLYRYKKYTDVRLVWAPEAAIAFFGGDADNFEYPRYNLDVTLFRVYEDDKPAQIPHYLRWSADGAAAGELVFVSGNPGRTQRIFTAAALRYLRDHRMPYVLNYLRRNEILLQQYALNGPEAARQASDDLLGIQNSRKAYTGMLQGLQNPSFLAAKDEAEKALHARLKQLGKASLVDAWSEIAKLQKQQVALLGQTASFSGRLYSIAETLVQMAAEDQKPSAERLREYRESARESLEQSLFSPAPIYPELELEQLADSLARFVELRGGDAILVQKVLAGKGPRERASELIAGTGLAEVATRQRLAQGGQKAIDASTDPMIELVSVMDAEFRRLRTERDKMQEAERQAYAQITEGTVAVQGTSTYPDATFTLRLAFGTVKGYTEDGQAIPPWTTMQGAFEHQSAHDAQGDWQLPSSWTDARDRLAADTPFNFVCTADIIGGNSGSPVINRNGEFVGIIFDGNIQSLTADFFYSDEVGRAVSVHSAAILEALKTVYGASHLVDELTASPSGS